MAEKPGSNKDLDFLSADPNWLKTCLVSHKIRSEKGRFWIDMIYTDPKDPLRKLVRTISDHPSLALAQRHADILQRQISADPRDPRKLDNKDADDIQRN
ncbi:MAG: hypothetical protein AAFQ01_02205 [Bacteroidota bacterium]